MIISTSNLVGIIDVGVDACGIISRSNKPEVEIWRTIGILNAKINDRVGLAMVSQCTKFEVSMFTSCEAMNGGAKCRKWGG